MTLSVSDIFMAPWQVQVVATAVQFDLFTILGDSEKTIEDIAGRCGAVPDRLDSLLDACGAMGLVHRRDDKFFNSHFSRITLREGDYTVDDFGSGPEIISEPVRDLCYWLSEFYVAPQGVEFSGIVAEVSVVPSEVRAREEFKVKIVLHNNSQVAHSIQLINQCPLRAPCGRNPGRN